MNRREQGFALILVIWALVLLSSLAGGFAYAVRHEIRVAGDMEAIMRAEAIATAVLNTAVLALSNTDPEQRWRVDSQTHLIPWPGASSQVTVRSESGRIDINRAPRELLAGLFSQLLTDADPDALADAIIDWRDSDSRPGPAGAELNAYLQAGYRYGPSNSPFNSVNELSQVIGFNSGMLDVASDYLTVYSRQPRVNASSADLVVLAAVPGIDRDKAAAFIAHRAQVLAEGGELDYTPLGTGRRFLDTRPGGKYLSLDIEVVLDEGLKRREHAVIQLDRKRGYRLLTREMRPVGMASGAKAP